MSSSTVQKTRIFVKQDLQQIGRVCRVDLSQPMANILSQIAQHFPPPTPQQQYTKLLLIDDSGNKAEFEIANGSDIERGDKLLLHCEVASAGAAAAAPVENAPSAAAPSVAAAAAPLPSLGTSAAARQDNVPVAMPSTGTVAVTAAPSVAAAAVDAPSPVASTNRGLRVASAAASSSSSHASRAHARAPDRKRGAPPSTRQSPRRKAKKQFGKQRRARTVISPRAVPEEERRRLSHVPFRRRDFFLFCNQSIEDPSADSYADAAKDLFDGIEFHANHWEYGRYFLPAVTPNLASDFVSLYHQLVKMETENAAGSSERTTMRGALTYLDKYQRHLLSQLK